MIWRVVTVPSQFFENRSRRGERCSARRPTAWVEVIFRGHVRLFTSFVTSGFVRTIRNQCRSTTPREKMFLLEFLKFFRIDKIMIVTSQGWRKFS